MTYQMYAHMHACIPRAHTYARACIINLSCILATTGTYLLSIYLPSLFSTVSLLPPSSFIFQLTCYACVCQHLFAFPLLIASPPLVISHPDDYVLPLNDYSEISLIYAIPPT
ncbi:hypothetical protein BO79DRAFT_41426 [Aspergillus costaricaensis CBS 115574]|uniref:Uncharacterized protein n=1 Tax=Aspergillus costaricaensis CBS 115574 TaxID=1448317 RepID=A0ACD1I6M5_9EURO|nr:hypothetical protein BO79DRAFT_41426 [Aspergillus costaricaensis CBS 115574]RAK85875.1 hypothetical protein BO79DRAFT_41426 [Aspergillus costaricaensis CBS 115574]